MKRYFSLFLIVVLCFSGCSLPDHSTPSSTDVASTSTDTDFVFYDLEKVCINDPMTSFSVFRDVVTDVLYLWRGAGYKGGLTVMLDPQSGLPLTYTRYLELSALLDK